MYSVVDISDYLIFSTKVEGRFNLSVLKHQKLLYYIQAWYLAFYGKKLFNEDFEAWVHGPVNKEIYNLYRDTKYIFSELELSDIHREDYKSLPDEVKLHIDTILDSYAKFTAAELERMTHEERPWLQAREGLNEYERGNIVIDNSTIESYYKARLI
jgi:uncharacterized phage-associated protein